MYSKTNNIMGKGNREKKRKTDSLHDNTTMEMQLQLEKLEGELFELRDLVEKTVEEAAVIKETNSRLKEGLDEERAAKRIITNELNEQQQYSRKNHIRIFGVRDSNKKETVAATEDIVINLLKNRLNVNLIPSDIEIAHRVGRFTATSDRAILVRFVNRKAKMDILYHRRQLKGSGVSIAEDLTSYNVRRLTQLKDLDCVAQAWSFDGKLFAKNKDSAIREVKGLDTLSEKLFDQQHSADRRPAPGQHRQPKSTSGIKTPSRRTSPTGSPFQADRGASGKGESSTTSSTSATTSTTSTLTSSAPATTSTTSTATSSTPTTSSTTSAATPVSSSAKTSTSVRTTSTSAAKNSTQQGQSSKDRDISESLNIAEAMILDDSDVEFSIPSASSTPIHTGIQDKLKELAKEKD